MSDPEMIEFDGLYFLNQLEIAYHENGLDGVVNLTKSTFPVDKKIRMKRDLENTTFSIYMIKRVTISKIDPDAILLSIGDGNVDSVIRSIGLPYLDIPFQINLHGSLIE